MKPGLTLAALLSLAGPLAISRNAAAETAWETGVPQATREQANKLYAAGNELFLNKEYGQALEKYQAAVALWDHPLIRFNLVRTLINLDRPLEAAEALERAMRFGDDPFDAEKYQAALELQSLLRGRVGNIEAQCAQDGVSLLLDGKPWFDCPATKTQRVLAGEHSLVGEKKGFATKSQRIVVGGGTTAKTTIKLQSLDDAVVLEYPYPRWVPATIGGLGFALALGGLAYYASGRSQMDEFENDFASQCATGCEKALDLPEHRPLALERDSAKLKGTIGITMMITGGVAFVGGGGGFLVDKPERVLPNVEVAPTNGGASATVGWRF